MPVYRGIGQRKFRLTFEQIQATGRYSEQIDTSVLTGEKTYSRIYERVVGKTLGTVCALRGDYLIYGWRPWNVPMALIWMYSAGLTVTALLAALRSSNSSTYWIFGWPGVVIGAALFYISFWWYFRSRYSHFIIFDRRHQLIHLPRWFSHKQDSIRWSEADLCVLDMPMGYLGESIATELHVVPPPLTLQQRGTKSWWRFFKYHQDSKQPHVIKHYDGHTVDGSEAVFSFIVDFMTQPPERCIALDVMPTFEVELEFKANNHFSKFVQKYCYFFAMIDPERLPTQPNWVRSEQGQGHQVRPAVRARFGWFGLWNKSYTLPPHLRGTKADPAYRDDPSAPLPVSRWFTAEGDGTAELIGQPPKVLAKILRGEGMPSQESLERTRLPAGGWPGPGHDWWYEEFADNRKESEAKLQTLNKEQGA